MINHKNWPFIAYFTLQKRKAVAIIFLDKRKFKYHLKVLIDIYIMTVRRLIAKENLKIIQFSYMYLYMYRYPLLSLFIDLQCIKTLFKQVNKNVLNLLPYISFIYLRLLSLDLLNQLLDDWHITESPMNKVFWFFIFCFA